MARDTNLKLLEQVIYSVFVRNHTQEGTFRAVIPDLPRIKALGTDIVWFLPIHPIGKVQRKGSLGSPYAIADYRGVNPEYGTMEDFRALVDAIHAQGMRCMIDVVYNHTSPDSWLAQHHPEWFYRKPDGAMGNRCGEWLDVVDLDYSHEALWAYQLDTLAMWAELVDGFRCDVASLVPVAFWNAARARVAKVKPDFVWLAESVHTSFIEENRAKGFLAHDDAELYEAFDITYDYDIRDRFEAYLRGDIPLEDYVAAIAGQEALYPERFIKLRFLENHDQPRAKHLIPDAGRLRNFTALIYLLRGATLVYAGQEVGCTHQPSLFDRDTVDFAVQQDLTGLMQRLAEIKRGRSFAESSMALSVENGCVVVRHTMEKETLVAILNLEGKVGPVAVAVPDGEYQDEVGGGVLSVQGGRLQAGMEPAVLVCGE